MNFRKARNWFNAGLVGLLLACGENPTEPTQPKTQPPTQQPPTQQTDSKITVTSTPVTQVDENSSYNYEIKATSSLPLAYEVSGPIWLNTISNFVSGKTPEVSKDSIVPVRVKIYNEKDSVIQSYNLTVKDLVNIYALTPQDTAKLSYVGTDTLVFSTPMNFFPGQIIASDTMSKAHDGLLRTVLDISQDGKIVHTRQTGLDEIPNLYLNFNQELLSSQIISSSGLPGVSLSPLLGPLEFNLDLHKVLLEGNPSITSDNVTLDGDISFSLKPNLAVKINKNLTLDSLLIAATLKDTANMFINAAPGIVPMNSLKIHEFNFNRFIIGYIPTPLGITVPVYARPKLELLVNFGFDLHQLETGISQRAELTAGLKYKQGNLTKILEYSNSIYPVPPHFTKSANIWARVGPRLTFYIYDVAGPYADIGGKLRFNVDSTGWQLYGGLDALIGAQMKIFRKEILDINASVLDYEELLAKRDSTVQPPADTLTGKIIYIVDSYTTGSTKHLYSMNPDGSNIQEIPNSAGASTPSCTSNGNLLYTITGASNNVDIYSMNIDGTGKTKITGSESNEMKTDPSMSYDGSKIAYIGGGYLDINHWQLYTMNPNGSGIQNISNDTTHGYWSPTWNPSKMQMAFSSTKSDSGPDIYTWSSSGMTKLTSGTGSKNYPSWSPDGSQIAFSIYDGNTHSLYLMNSDGSGLSKITTNIDAWDSSWSPDGKYLTYTSGEYQGADIYIVKTDGTKNTRLTNNSNLADFSPAWCK